MVRRECRRKKTYRREKTSETNMTTTSLSAICVMGLLRLTSGQPYPDPGLDLKTPWPEPKPALPKPIPELYPPHVSYPLLKSMRAQKNALARADTRQSDARMRRSAATGSGLSETEKTHLLDIHNHFRRISHATAMNKLYWSDDLARHAQSWAEGCDFYQGQPPGAPNNIGQNLYASTHVRVNLTWALLVWYNEIQYYNLTTLDCQDGIDPITMNDMCGKYTAMVWATTRKLGCGFYKCPSLKGAQVASNASYVVCNYSPAGNVRGQPPFVRGAACSGCTRHKCDNGLCDWMCYRCYVSGYNCTRCRSSNGDLSSKCTAYGPWLTSAPSKGSTVRHVQVRLTSVVPLFTFGSNKVTLRHTQIFGSIMELTVTATRLDRYNLKFQAPPLPQQYSGLDWQLFLFTDDANYCDLGMTFAFYGDPSITSIQPRNTILAGGTMMTVSGRYLDAVETAQIVIKMTNHKPSGDEVTVFKGEICKFYRRMFICTTPEVTPPPRNNTSRRKRQTEDAMVNTDELEFEINVELDGAPFVPPSYDNPGSCGSVCVFQDPNVYTFDPLQTECADRSLTTIHGEWLNLGASKNDYNISVGHRGVCVVSSITTNVIRCRPELIQDLPHRNGPQRVVVRVGQLVFFVAYLCNASSPTTSSPALTDWDWNIIIIPFASSGSLVICIIAGACCYSFIRKRCGDLHQERGSPHHNRGNVNQASGTNEQR